LIFKEDDECFVSSSGNGTTLKGKKAVDSNGTLKNVDKENAKNGHIEIVSSDNDLTIVESELKADNRGKLRLRNF
jgi:hypothetical protein